ncbi:MAG TPA: hypothetical protein PLJ71_06790 [Candidatus Hydrogenedentes bacterium]|nr:hypothetical protein [Candidatus Hydrogenedentota bacterium]
MKMPLIEKLGRSIARRRLWWPILLLAVALPLPSLSGGTVADDNYFRMLARGAPGAPELARSPLDAFNFTGTDSCDKTARKERGLIAWWTPEDMQIAFWRPLTALTHWFDNALLGEHAWLMHLHNIAWYGALVAAVVLLYRRFDMPAWVAALAAMLYAVDDAHALPVAWIAGRNALLSGLFGVLSLIAHDAWRREKRRLAGMIAPVLFAAALLCGEAAAGAGGFLVAYAVFIERGPRWRSAASLLPYACVGAAWRVLYVRLGYGVAASSLYLEPFEQPLAYFRNVVTHVPLMLSGQFAFPDPAVWLVLSAPGRAVLLAWACCVIGVVLWLMWPGLEREPQLRFWLAGTLMAMAPACATWPQNRLMLLPGVGAMALLAHAIVLGLRRRGSEPVEFHSGKDRLRRYAAGGLFVLNTLAASLMLSSTAAAIGFSSAYMTRLDESLPETPELDGTDMVIVSAPMDAFATSIPTQRSSQASRVPRSVLLLRGGMGDADIFRADSHTMIVTTPGGLLERPWSMLFRDVDTHPFAPGEAVRLPIAAITVLSVSPNGNPLETEFRFEKPLEQGMQWRIWDRAAFAEFHLPEVGGSVHIPGGDLIGLTLAVLKTSRTIPE